MKGGRPRGFGGAGDARASPNRGARCNIGSIARGTLLSRPKSALALDGAIDGKRRGGRYGSESSKPAQKGAPHDQSVGAVRLRSVGSAGTSVAERGF